MDLCRHWLSSKVRNHSDLRLVRRPLALGPTYGAFHWHEASVQAPMLIHRTLATRVPALSPAQTAAFGRDGAYTCVARV